MVRWLAALKEHEGHMSELVQANARVPEVARPVLLTVAARLRNDPGFLGRLQAFMADDAGGSPWADRIEKIEVAMWQHFRATKGEIMNDLSFAPSREIVKGRRVPVYRLKCSRCGSVTPPVICSSGDDLTPRQVRRSFETRGWSVDGSADRDLCPACRGEERQQKQEEKKEMKPSPPANGKYRPITIADRRIIIQKLTEVYQDEDKGYQAPWTDAKVAKDLGCSEDWVSKIREENFGGTPDFPDLREVIEASKGNTEALADLHSKLTEMNRRMVALREKVVNDAKLVEQIRKQVG